MSSTLDDADLSRIAPYVSSTKDDVFALSGLPEEVIAVLFAYYSRSRDDLRTNLARLLRDDELAVGPTTQSTPSALAAEKARAFHEKWVVGYGHSSVAEHAVVHLALENVSIVASKVIEDLRLGSYTEKSTRYVVFDTASFVDPPELEGELLKLYRETNAASFQSYLSLFEQVDAALRKRSPRGEKQTERGYEAVLRAQACDLLRGLLPAGTKTNLGLTANARALEGLLSKMLSHPLAEVRNLATSMWKHSLAVTPTLVKYARENPFRKLMGEKLSNALPKTNGTERVPSSTSLSPSSVRLLRSDPNALENIVLALAYELGDPSQAASLLTQVETLDGEKLAAIVRSSLEGRGTWDAPPRAFETASITVELTLDYGAYRDLQRHRMLSPFAQRVGCELGAEIPEDIIELGLEAPYREAHARAEAAFETLAKHDPMVAQYVVPLGYRTRVLWTMNLREAFHVIELRSAKQGHLAYRIVAQDLHRAVVRAYPWLEGVIRVDMGRYALARA